MRISWEAIHEQLRHIGEQVDRTTELSPEHEAEVLRARAEQLARPVEREATDILQVIVVRLGLDRIALPLGDVQEISAISALVRVPCTPDWVLGMVNLRGVIVSVVDLRFFLGLRREGILDMPRLVVVGNDRLRVGLAVEEIEGARLLSPKDIETPVGAAAHAALGCVRGITADSVNVLDVAALLEDERLIHDEAVQ